jgi:UDP-galactopyranose mutase
MTRFAREHRVFFVEEPVYDAAQGTWLETTETDGLILVTPHAPAGTSEADALAIQRRFVDELIARHAITHPVLWYYTPMALAFSDHLPAAVVVYDCMDELSAFAHAPVALKTAETELLRKAGVVFTGGQSLYEAKRHRHPNVHAFPSSVDVPHFAQGRTVSADPEDQSAIPHPRLGFCGVIDERMDLELLDGVARRRPDWHFVMIGPVVKIDPATLPRHANIHYLGAKAYADLPRYIGAWDVALLPFARNDATRFISPTKTPEYLAAGRPVVSTTITDVVRPYGQLGLARIADSVDEFVAACEAALTEDSAARLQAADRFLADLSWDRTWAAMQHCIDAARTAPTVTRRAGDGSFAGRVPGSPAPTRLTTEQVSGAAAAPVRQ